MKEQTALVKDFDETDELYSVPGERKRRDGEPSSLVLESLNIPNRNWNAIIADYNSKNKKKFPFTALQCKIVVDFVKKGVPATEVFGVYGYSPIKYNNMRSSYLQYEEKFDELATKETLTDDEYDQFQSLLRHPTRLLMSDIARAEAVANCVDWEHFNEVARIQPDILMAKMKAKFKDVFSDKNDNNNSVNIQINVAGDWLDDI